MQINKTAERPCGLKCPNLWVYTVSVLSTTYLAEKGTLARRASVRCPLGSQDWRDEHTFGPRFRAVSDTSADTMEFLAGRSSKGNVNSTCYCTVVLEQLSRR